MSTTMVDNHEVPPNPFDFGVKVDRLKTSDFDRAGIPVRVDDNIKKLSPNRATRRASTKVKASAMTAAKNEVNNPETVDFEYDGKSYTVKRPEKWPIRALKELESNRIASGLELILGTEQWNIFAEDHVIEDSTTLFEAINAAVGTKAGE